MRGIPLGRGVKDLLLVAPDDEAGRLTLRALLLGFAFWIPISIVGAQVFGYGAAAVWLAMARRRRSLGVRLSWAVPMGLFAVFSVVGALAGPDPARGVRRLHRLLLLVLVFAPSASLPADDARRGKWAVRLLAAFVAGASLQAAYDVIRIGRALLGGARGMALYGLGNMRDPQFYMCAVLIGLAAGGSPAAAGTRGWRWGSLLLNAAGLVLHFKRGVWLAFAGAAALVCGVSRRRLLVPGGLLVVALLGLSPVRARLGALREEWRPDASRRILWTQVAPALLRQYPWGVGRGVLRNEDLCRYGPIREPNLTHVHNNILQIGVESGWSGLAAWIVWMGTVACAMVANVRRARVGRAADEWAPLAVAACFLGLHLNGGVEYNFGDSEIFMWFILLMGLTLLQASAGRPASVEKADAGGKESS